MAETKQLDGDLVNGLKLAKSQRVFFALVLKGGADGALVVSKAKITPKAITAAQKQCGGKAVIKGACFYEDGQYVFEVAKAPPATMKAVVKLIAKRDAGLGIDPIVRLGTNPDLADDDVVNDTPEVAQSPLEGMAQFKERLQQVKPRVDALKAADPTHHADLTRRLVAAMGKAQAKDFPTALTALDEIEAALKSPPAAKEAAPPATAAIQAALAKMIPLVKNAVVANPDRKNELLEPLKRCQDHLKTGQAIEAKADLLDLNRALKLFNDAIPPPLPPTGKAPTKEETPGKEEVQKEAEAKEGTTAPGSPGKAPQTPAAPGAAEFTARLKAILPDLQNAQAGTSPLAQELREKSKEAQVFARQKDFTQANAILDTVEALIKQVLAAGPGTPTEAADAAQVAKSATATASAEAEWHKRLAEVEPRYDQAVKLTTGDVGRMRMLHDIALEQADGGNYDKALATWKRLEDTLASAQGVAATIPPGLVKYRTSLLNFEKVMKTIRSQIGQLTSSVAKLPDEADLAKRLAKAVEDLNSELSDSIDKAMSAAKNVREPYNEATRGMIQEKIALIKADPLIKIVDKNIFVPMQMEQKLVTALTEIASAMV